ncbi:paralemmin-1 isoform X2 [Salmo trutta]|uniref:paralemmin-1 isoform X2 n=1 Tax=Salmo trutta TaxID=8032 RepID=UPI0011302124|nr:paralemmin-1-like isoform X2 [Salmo trutta]
MSSVCFSNWIRELWRSTRCDELDAMIYQILTVTFSEPCLKWKRQRRFPTPLEKIRCWLSDVLQLFVAEKHRPNMDEAEKYQQRVHAIADKRRKQQVDEKARREMEEEWLTQAQRKRKSLRDQWLSENPQPVPGRSAENYTELPTEEDIVEVIESTSYTVTNAQSNRQADIEEGGIQDIIRAAGGQLSGPVMERVIHENGLEGRSVLGMVTVQVERDSKTGVTKIRSVVPVSGAPRALGETVFNDSRKSVHHVGGAEGQPSAEELGQLLSVINDVGMQVLLDEIPVVPQQKAEEKIEVGGGMEEEVDNVEDPATPTTLGYTE